MRISTAFALATALVMACLSSFGTAAETTATTYKRNPVTGSAGDPNWQEEWAYVSGGGSGLGLNIAKELIADGASIAMAAFTFANVNVISLISARSRSIFNISSMAGLLDVRLLLLQGRSAPDDHAGTGVYLTDLVSARRLARAWTGSTPPTLCSTALP